MKFMWLFVKYFVLLYIGCILVGIGLVCFMTIALAPVGVACFSLCGTIGSRVVGKRISESDEYEPYYY